MVSKLTVFFHDDWEVRGNGLGNVAHLQYVPALGLMRICKEFGIPVTFMAELGQQLAHLRFSNRDRGLAIQARLWEECVQLMIDEGMDVQPHIHPHWFESEYRDGFVHVGRNWNLATFEPQLRREIVEESLAYLRRVAQEVKPDYRITTFKAGSHALQPSEGLLQDLQAEGIKIVLGPRFGLKIDNPEFHIDYHSLEEPTLPYYPKVDDVTRVGTNCGLAVLPLTYWDVDAKGKFYAVRRGLRSRIARRSQANQYPYYGNVPETIRQLNPRVDPAESRLIRRLTASRRSGLNLGGPQSFGELRHILDRMVSRLDKINAETVPLVVESHSKDFEGNWEAIARFFEYVSSRYGSMMEFVTATQFANRLETKSSSIREESE